MPVTLGAYVICFQLLRLSMAVGPDNPPISMAWVRQGGLPGAYTPSLARRYPTTSLKKSSPYTILKALSVNIVAKASKMTILSETTSTNTIVKIKCSKLYFIVLKYTLFVIVCFHFCIFRRKWQSMPNLQQVLQQSYQFKHTHENSSWKSLCYSYRLSILW